MRVQIGSMSGGLVNIGGVRVICPDCANDQKFSNVNVSSSGGTLCCGIYRT